MPIAVRDAVHDRLARRPGRNGPNLRPDETPHGKVVDRVGVPAGLLDVRDLFQERSGAPHPVGAVRPRYVAAEVVNADCGRGNEEQRPGVGKPTPSVDQVEPPEQILVGCVGEGGCVPMPVPPEVHTSCLDRRGAQIGQGVARRLRRPIEPPAVHPACVPGSRIDLHATVVHAPSDPPLAANRLDGLMRRQHEQPLTVQFRGPDRDGQLPLGEFPYSIAEPFGMQPGADPGPVVGNPQDDGAAAGGVRHAGHLTGQETGRPVVPAVAGENLPAVISAPRFLLDVDVGRLDLSGRQALLQQAQRPFDLFLQGVGTQNARFHDHPPIELYFLFGKYDSSRDLQLKLYIPVIKYNFR